MCARRPVATATLGAPAPRRRKAVLGLTPVTPETIRARRARVRGRRRVVLRPVLSSIAAPFPGGIHEGARVEVELPIISLLYRAARWAARET